jgi:capsular exopolysaccharide synthesis family protein
MTSQNSGSRGEGSFRASWDELAEEKKEFIGQMIARWRMMTLVFLACLIAGLAVVYKLPRYYTGEAVLLLDTRRPAIADAVSSLTLQSDPTLVNDEISMLQLPELALQVIRNLKLTSRPEYQAQELADSPAELESPEAEMHAIRIFERNLKVTNEPRTYAIRLRYTSTDPIHAAAVANAVAERHLANQDDARIRSIHRASEWFNHEIGLLQERVMKAEVAEQAYRREHDLGDDRVASTAQQEVNALAIQVTLATAELAQAQAKLREATGGIMTSMEETVRVAAEREANVRRELKDARRRLEQVMQAETGLRPLVREVGASRAVLEDMMKRARRTDSQMDAPRPELHMVSRALVPILPSSFGKARMAIGVAAGSGVLAFAAAFFAIQFQSGFRSIDEAERRLGVDGIGEIPKVRGAARQARRKIVEHPSCRFAEAFRSICVHMPELGKKTRLILISSAAPNEGKTLLAGCLAQTLALSSYKCLLIDGDLRRPTAHKLLGLPQRTGLCEVLAGTATLEQAVTKVLPGPLSFLSAGEVTSDPLQLLSRERLTAFFDAARQHFELIIIDSPPLLAVSDATLLAAHADYVAMAVRWRSTTRAAAARAITKLGRNTGKVPGLVLTQVDHGSMSRYEEGRYGMDLSYPARPWVPQHGAASAVAQSRHPAE